MRPYLNADEILQPADLIKNQAALLPVEFAESALEMRQEGLMQRESSSLCSIIGIQPRLWRGRRRREPHGVAPE
jgi:hypothetical protein